MIQKTAAKPLKRKSKKSAPERAKRRRDQELPRNQNTDLARFRLAAVVESSNDAIIAKDLNGIITAWNNSAERLFGYSAEEMLGQPITRLIPPERHKEESQILGKIRSGQRVELYETKRLCKNGTILDLSLSISPIRNDRGEIIGASKIARDITDRKRADEALQTLNEKLEMKVLERTQELTASNDELEAFCYSIAHDLRAPLRSINGFSQVLLKKCAGKLDSEEREYFHRILSSSEKMAKLIDGLLDLAKLVRTELHFRTVNLSLLAETFFQNLKKTEPGRQVDVMIHPELKAVGDERLLQSLLANLFENAWKFTGKRPRTKIEFGIVKNKHEDAYFVRDDGVGFDMAYVDKLFKPFERLHVDEFPGTGIGLATVQRIIRRHGGRVWAEGIVDKGATFYFTLGENSPGHAS